jgi:aspartyl-tRNA(Asn)/glutamyl-tRNA(Gln) amidotransferase subunit A
MRRRKTNQTEKCHTNVILCVNSNYDKRKELTYFAKDNFWTKDFPTTASANFLVNFWPSQNAFVIELLEKKKIKLLGKTALDEFACGGTGLHASTGPIFNPYDLSCIAGGSSSGSA